MENLKTDNTYNIIKYIRVFSITILMVSLFFCLSNIEASSYKIDDYKINATIKSNGDMHVEEYLKYNFSEDMNGLYRDILYKYNYENQIDSLDATSSRYQASGISNINAYVSDTDFYNLSQMTLEEESKLHNGISGFFSITDKIQDGYRKNIKVYSPVKSGNSKYVKYEYDLEDVAVKYADKGEIYWNFVGKDWACGIKNLEIKISFENDLNADEIINVYPHSYTRNLNYNIENGVVYIHAKNLESGVALDARVVFPVETLTFVTKTKDALYNMKELEQIENKMSNGKKRFLISNQISIYLFIGGIFGLVIIIIETNRIIRKGKKKSKDLEIFTDILDKYNLGEYSTMLNMYGGYSNNNLLMATILDLANREYILMEPEKKLEVSRFSKIEYDYNMKLNSNKDYSTLNEYEINIINLLFNGKVGILTNIANFEKTQIELNKRLEKISKSTKELLKYSNLTQSLNLSESKKIYNEVPKKLITSVITFVLVYIALIIINIFIVSPVVSTFSMIFSIFSIMLGIFAACFITSAKSIKDEYIDEYNKLMGLKKYLKEYSTLKDRFPIEMVLWGKYLVFATLFGIADKVSKEFKEELIAKGYDDDYIYMTYPILNMSIHSNDIYSSFVASTGSSSSGGYSGSGSGGGGGRRWRRRCLLRMIL